jgi:hypothetical protein
MLTWRQIQQDHTWETDGEHIAYDGRHWTAQICIAGHLQEGGQRVIPAEKYCDRCGAQTIHQCPACNGNIKGALRGYGDWLKGPPLFCQKCGRPYPWTQAAMDTVSQAIEGSDLSAAEKQEANDDLNLMLKNTPGAEGAARRTHGRFAKAGRVLRTVYIEWVVPLVAATVAETMKNG